MAEINDMQEIPQGAQEKLLPVIECFAAAIRWDERSTEQEKNVCEFFEYLAELAERGLYEDITQTERIRVAMHSLQQQWAVVMESLEVL